MYLRSRFDLEVKKTRKWIAKIIAALWQYTYRIQYQLDVIKRRYEKYVWCFFLLLLVSVSAYLSPVLQELLTRCYPTDREIEGLRGLFLNVGSALIGAAAIVSSLVLFAMQVNIERMPHGLFSRLSTDNKLLGAFASAFLLAICVATLSTFVEQAHLALVVLAASWAIALILIAFLYAYRRALVLISPLQQLGLLIQDSRRELGMWARRALRAIPLLNREENLSATSSLVDSTHDLARLAFFKINSRWADGATRSIEHSMSFARRYSEQGDYEVSGAALNAIVAINAAYISTKGKTFFADNYLFENPLTTDAFINDTLERLRQNLQRGISRRDEQQIGQTLQALAALVHVYLRIDYSKRGGSKSHAQLAAGYLANAVQDIVPHGMADVLLEGQRLLGKSAQYIVAQGQLDGKRVMNHRLAVSWW